ncbi:hypothetical protein G7B40_000190 [Aetokthonos hydrillicola Thurmond2011]|jgi:hypothetical protein|uniref:Uncharacterized protein n=1 Tax=Aetokthonos hydrillicola Thurmond2011 TaxID=2712845 RepID=A0AAP5I3A0_9CYAN|nr:hypothetical protein [Aetokthonos hydrillicola]MBO3460148.1 hypothetical protein [Aetokthonos hydrillicola CCALA 1050]MBW4590475.1 hypothetical protein [Aetokthonos hydrillicola CCALA 1050]MDR9893004.1 hypothetical protein [Aetokthonos hydrillicola Thurmond2011]
MSELSPYEENILDFVKIAQNQPNLFTAEDRAALGKLLATLPDDIEQISDALALWYEDRPHILNTILDLPVEESASHRGPGGRKTRLSPKDAKDMIDNIVRQSTPSQKTQVSPPNNPQNDTISGNTQS